VSIISGAAGHIRNELKSKVQIRTLPELKILLDDSIQYGMKIESILKSIKEEDRG
jgi:ribosome-binding factor A